MYNSSKDKLAKNQFIEALRDVFSRSADEARWRGVEKDKSQKEAFDRIQYASPTEEMRAGGFEGDWFYAPGAKNLVNDEWVYFPISWRYRDGDIGNGYLIADNNMYGSKVFGLESSNGMSYSASGAKEFLNDIINKGGSINLPGRALRNFRNGKWENANNPLWVAGDIRNGGNENMVHFRGDSKVPGGEGTTKQEAAMDLLKHIRKYGNPFQGNL